MHSHNANDRTAGLLQLYRPDLTANPIDPFQEASLTVLLKLIDALPDAALKAELNDPALAGKLKALLMILAHDLHTRMSKWVSIEGILTYDFLCKKSELLTKAIVQDDKVARDAILNQVKSYFMIRSKLFAEIFTFDENKLDDAIYSTVYSNEEFQNKEHLTHSILTAFTNYNAVMNISDLQICIEQFDFEKFNDARIKAYETDVTIVCRENNLFSEEINFEELSRGFVLYHVQFMDTLQTTLRNMNPSHFPVLNPQVFTRLYSEAFQHLDSDSFIIYEFNLFECYLEQARKPERRTEFRHLLMVHILPALAVYCEDNAIDKQINFEKIISMVDKNTSPADRLSMHQMLNNAYLKLFSSTERQSAQIFTDLQLTDQEIQPLFENTIPGTISEVEIFLVNNINTNYLQYQKLFDNQDRAASIKIFKENLKLADSLPKIVALTEAAHPFIDIHKHFRLDDKLGKTNTNTWSKSLKAARADAMKILKLHVDSSEDKSKTIEALEYWRGNGIFSTHRSNFKILGAFGRTKAQVEIDTMLTTLRKP
jgi:hypothetical protein